jgi:hypothetical protein
MTMLFRSAAEVHSSVVERFNQERFTIHVWAATIENYITGPISFVYIDDIFYVYR